MTEQVKKTYQKSIADSLSTIGNLTSEMDDGDLLELLADRLATIADALPGPAQDLDYILRCGGVPHADDQPQYIAMARSRRAAAKQETERRPQAEVDRMLAEVGIPAGRKVR